MEVDFVTGLAPRSVLARWLDDHGARPLAAVLADVVGLKSLNETRGFAAGDAALRAAAERLHAAAPAAAIRARLGGDELIAVFAEDDAPARAAATVARLRDPADQPPMRAAWLERVAAEPLDHFLDRLYATMRRC